MGDQQRSKEQINKSQPEKQIDEEAPGLPDHFPDDARKSNAEVEKSSDDYGVLPARDIKKNLGCG